MLEPLLSEAQYESVHVFNIRSIFSNSKIYSFKMLKSKKRIEKKVLDKVTDKMDDDSVVTEKEKLVVEAMKLKEGVPEELQRKLPKSKMSLWKLKKMKKLLKTQ